MSRHTRKFSGRIIRPTRRAVLFQTGEKKSWLPKVSITVERTDGQHAFAPGEVVMHIPSRMAEKKFGPAKRNNPPPRRQDAEKGAEQCLIPQPKQG